MRDSLHQQDFGTVRPAGETTVGLVSLWTLGTSLRPESPEERREEM